MAENSFFWQGLTRFREIGSVIPSSNYAGRKIAQNLPTGNPNDIFVEFGGGEGSVTRAVLNKLGPEQQLYTFEINPAFCENLRNIGDKRLHIFNRDALEFPGYLPKAPVSVFSVLPLALMHKQKKRALLDSVQENLVPGGEYLQLQYSLRDFSLVGEYFQNMQKKFIWRNFPPAYIYWGENVNNRN